MPQMNPIYWVTLFFMFIAVFLLTNSINYFYLNKFSLYFKFKNNLNKSINWKW